MLGQSLLNTATWSAGGSSEIELDRLPSLIAGKPAHLVGLECKLVLGIDDDATNASPGIKMCRAISTLKLKDRLGVEVINVTGAQLRLLGPILSGCIHHADPSDISNGTAGVVSRTVRFFIPFFGGPRGIIAARAWSDFIQPCDRFRNGGKIEVTWSAALFAGTGYGTVSTGTLTVTPILVGQREVVQGADLRIRTLSHADDQKFSVSFAGLRCLALAITNTDLDHSDYTRIDAPQQLLQQADPVERVAAFNAMLPADAAGVPSYLDTTPEFLPVLFAAAGAGFSKLPGFGLGKVDFDLTNTNSAAQTALIAELHDREALAMALRANNRSDVYASFVAQKPLYAMKNRHGKSGIKGELLDKVCPAKLLYTA